MIDYNIYYRDELPLNTRWSGPWDLFVSAYNSSERVNLTFDNVDATHKDWIIHLEYGYSESDYPTNGYVFVSDQRNEGDYIREYFDGVVARGVDLPKSRICVDMTGFMRPHLMFLVRYLEFIGVKKFEMLYSEPRQYSAKELTTFSDGAVEAVRQVAGFEGNVSADTSRDLLIIGAGYDDKLISEVAEDKDKAEKLKLLGLPSLSADMYQESVYRSSRAADAVGEHKSIEFFAPANDPFVTATVLSEICSMRSREAPITNLYLSPLATKPQAVGFALFYIGECQSQNASIIFPISASYSKETSGGISRVWKYTLEFPLI